MNVVNVVGFVSQKRIFTTVKLDVLIKFRTSIEDCERELETLDDVASVKESHQKLCLRHSLATQCLHPGRLFCVRAYC